MAEPILPTLAQTPFYLDWTFWAFLASAVAILLSQLPPIRLWFSKGKLISEAGNKVWVTHMLGYTNVQVYLNLRNVGGRTVRLRGIAFELSLHGRPVAAIAAQNYIANELNPKPVVFTPFNLRPGDEWGYRVNAFVSLVAKEDKVLGRLRRALKRNIADKVAERDAKGEPHKLVVADDEVLLPMLDLFKRNFVLEAGEYDLAISFDTDTPRANLSAMYRFTLYEADSAELKAYADDYKHGFGPAVETEDHPGVICELHSK
jgi:hypothetical protein